MLNEIIFKGYNEKGYFYKNFKRLFYKLEWNGLDG